LIGRVRDIDDGGGRFVLKPDAPFGDRRATQYRIDGGRVRRGKARISCPQRVVLIADIAESAIVGIGALRARALAFGDDSRARGDRGLGAEDRFCPSDVYFVRGELERWIAAEEILFSKA